MVNISELWLAILVASVVVFFASAIMWMLLPHHKQDIRFLGDKEQAYLDAIEPIGITPGLYAYPGCEMKDMKSESAMDRWKTGPWGLLIIYPGQPHFAANLTKSFLATLLITIIAAYLSGHAAGHGAAYAQVFKIAFIAAMLGHCTGGMSTDFFLGKPGRFVITQFIDGLVYALITAAIFAAMWPGVTQVLEIGAVPAG